MRSRLYKIEDKLDHVLYHHGHEVTPHHHHMTPFGIQTTEHSNNPNSLHNQMKTGDHMGMMMDPMGMGMMGGMGAGMGMGGMGMMHPMMGGMGAGMGMGGVGMMHPMMGGMGAGMGMGGMGMPMNAANYPDQQTAQAQPIENRIMRRLMQLK